MCSFTEAFADELVKVAGYDNSMQGSADAINSTQGRNKQLAGKLQSPLVQQTAQSVPPPETSPPSMQTYV